MSSCNYGCATLPDHQQSSCAKALGGIGSIAIMDCDHTITNPANAAQWTENIASGKVKVINGVRGEIPTPEAVMIDNTRACGSTQEKLGDNITLSWTDSNVLGENDDFYAKLNSRRAIIAFYMCTEDEIRISTGIASFNALPVTVPNSNQQVQSYTASAMFFVPVPTIATELYDAPVGIFSA